MNSMKYFFASGLIVAWGAISLTAVEFVPVDARTSTAQQTKKTDQTAQKDVKQKEVKQKEKNSKTTSKKTKKESPTKETTKVTTKKTKPKKDDQKKTEKKKKKKTTNPLGNLFKNLFRNNSNQPIIPKNNKKKGDSKKQNSDARKRLGRDSVEQQAAIQPEHVKILQRISKRIDQAKWRDTIELIVQYSGLLDKGSESLFRRKNDEWTSSRQELNRLIGTLPPDILQKYQLKISGTAERELALARKDSNLEDLSKVASRYFHTPAGHKAANQLATIYFDRGSFALATYWYRILLDSNIDDAANSIWLMRAAYAFQVVGYQDGISRVEKKLKELHPNGLVNIGTHTISMESWFKKNSLPQISPNKELEDWWTLHGVPSRLGTVVGSEPLLISRWETSSTLSHSIRERVRILNEDLISQQRVPIPVAQPITIDGKIAIRTFYGVQVFEASTGKLLWRTRPGISAENLLTGMKSSGDMSDQMMAMQQAMVIQRGVMMQQQSSATTVDFSALTGYLYRNGSHGMISSDGSQLFVVEDQALFIPNRNYYGWGQDPSAQDPHGRDWKSNKIAAYDLNSGRPKWEVGGRNFDETFNRPLAGYYFFGPPVAVDDELYVIGEKDDEISLISLDPVSGQKNWSHLLAYSDKKIEQDTLRRFSYIQPSVGEEIIVCPTTSGWILGLDKQNHSIVWAHRYSQLKKDNRPNGRNYYNVTPMPALNSRWMPSAPIVSSGRVIYTPLEEPILDCLSLFDGRRLWKIEKKEALYLAGVFEDSVVVVEKTAIKAYHLKDGKIRWTLPIENREDFPAGRGTAVGDLYYLPLNSGQLWAIDTKTGKIVSKQFLAENRNSNLGNLLMYRGMLLSANALGMTAYEQKDVLTKKIRERETKNPNDGWALLKKAEIALLKKDFTKSLDLLHRISKNELKKLDETQHRKILLYTLSSLVLKDLKNSQKYLAELSRESKTDAEKFSYLRLKAESLVARGNPEEAIRVLWSLRTIPYESIERRDISNVRIPKVRWLAGRLTELWQKLSQKSRENLDRSLFADIFSEKMNDKKYLAQNLVLMKFHPDYLTVVKKNIQNHIEEKRFLEAEAEILQLLKTTGKPVVAEIGFDLAISLHKAGFTHATAAIFTELQARHPKATRTNGAALTKEVVKFVNENHIATAEKSAKLTSWGQHNLELKKSGTGYSSSYSQTMDTSESRSSYFRDFRFEISPHRRFVMTEVEKERMQWLFPLSSPSRSSQYHASFSFGHAMIFLYGDLIYCISPLEKRILWFKPIEEFSSRYSAFRAISKQPTSPMVQSNILGETSQSSQRGTHSLLSRSKFSGMLPVVNSNYIAAYGNRRLIVMDSLTGKVMWTYERLKSEYKVLGLENYVLLVPNNNSGSKAKNKSETIVLQAFDGKKVTLKNIDKYVRNAVDVVENDLIVAETKSRGFSFLKKHETTISRRHVETGKTLWKITFNQKTRLARLAGGYLATLSNSGEFQLVDLHSGKTKSFPKIPKKEFSKYRSFYVVSDPSSIYLVMNRSKQGINRFNYQSGTLPSVAVQGMICAYDKKTTTIRWKQKIKQSSLLAEQFQQSPLLVFSSQKYEMVQGLGFGYSKQSLLAIDKKTGKRIFEKSHPTYYSYPQQMRINLRDQYVELRSYNEKIRLQVSKTKTTSISKPAQKTIPNKTQAKQQR